MTITSGTTPLTPLQQTALDAIRTYRQTGADAKRDFQPDLVPSFFRAVYAILDTFITDPDDVPSRAQASDWIRGCLDKRLLKKGSFRWLKNSQKKMSDGVYALFSAVRWHNSGGSLWSMHPHAAARKGSLEARADTLAHVLLLITGKRSRAIGAWKRALGR